MKHEELIKELVDSDCDYTVYRHLIRWFGDARIGVMVSFLLNNQYMPDLCDLDNCGLSEIDARNVWEFLIETNLVRHEEASDADKDVLSLPQGIWIVDYDKLYDLVFGEVDYKTYLRSRSWQCRRIVALMEADYKCRLCGKAKQLDVHHNNYKSLGNESKSDLIALCRSCHSKFHGKGA